MLRIILSLLLFLGVGLLCHLSISWCLFVYWFLCLCLFFCCFSILHLIPLFIFCIIVYLYCLLYLLLVWLIRHLSKLCIATIFALNLLSLNLSLSLILNRGCSCWLLGFFCFFALFVKLNCLLLFLWLNNHHLITISKVKLIPCLIFSIFILCCLCWVLLDKLIQIHWDSLLLLPSFTTSSFAHFCSV